MKTILPEGLDSSQLDHLSFFYNSRDFDETVDAIVTAVITPETVGDRFWELKFPNNGATIKGVVPLAETGIANSKTLGFFVGQTVGVKIKNIDKGNNLVACSRREAVEEMRWKIINNFTEGETIAGLVRFASLDYVGIDIGGGVIIPVPFSEVAFSPGVPLEILYQVGQLVNVIITSINKEKNEINIKLEDPWENTQLNRGDMVLGKVVKIQQGRAYVKVGNIIGLAATGRNSLEENSSASFQVTLIDKVEKKLRLKPFAVERIRAKRKVRARREREKNV